VDRFHDLVDRWCFRSTMDPRIERGRSSLERSPCGATGQKSSLRRRGEGEGDGVELIEAKSGAVVRLRHGREDRNSAAVLSVE
jgi:hypothetical protein